MAQDPRQTVAIGYDQIADAYIYRFEISIVRQRWFERLIDGLPPQAKVLDLGCGAGLPVARDLAALGHEVTGIDGSPEQIARARENVPHGAFFVADMSTVSFPDAAFDAIGACYSITHLPPASQVPLIERIATWLKPGGKFVGSFGTGEAGEWTGTTMFSGHAGEAGILDATAKAGLIVRQSLVDKQDNEDAQFLWIEESKAA